MRRKSQKKAKPKNPIKGAATPQPPHEGKQEREGGVPDYGGLPDRDLKKNLGCG